MAEQVTDLHDVKGPNTIARLRGLPAPGVPDITEPVIIAAYSKLVMGILTKADLPAMQPYSAAQRHTMHVVKISGLTEHVHDGGTVCARRRCR